VRFVFFFFFLSFFLFPFLLFSFVSWSLGNTEQQPPFPERTEPLLLQQKQETLGLSRTSFLKVMAST